MKSFILTFTAKLLPTPSSGSCCGKGRHGLLHPSSPAPSLSSSLQDSGRGHWMEESAWCCNPPAPSLWLVPQSWDFFERWLSSHLKPHRGLCKNMSEFYGIPFEILRLLFWCPLFPISINSDYSSSSLKKRNNSLNPISPLTIVLFLCFPLSKTFRNLLCLYSAYPSLHFLFSSTHFIQHFFFSTDSQKPFLSGSPEFS